MPFQEQFSRIKRLNKNIKRFSDAENGNFEDALDAFTSFFIQCYHLRDWFIESGFEKVDVDSFIKESIWLSLCRDIANKQKHRSITKYKPNNDFVPDQFYGVSTPITRYYDHFIHKEARYGVDVWQFKMPVDVIDFADKCVQEWERFLNLRHQVVVSP